MDYKNYIAQKLNIEGVEKDALKTFIEIPPNNAMGDYALPCFAYRRLHFYNYNYSFFVL